MKLGETGPFLYEIFEYGYSEYDVNTLKTYTSKSAVTRYLREASKKDDFLTDDEGRDNFYVDIMVGWKEQNFPYTLVPASFWLTHIAGD